MFQRRNIHRVCGPGHPLALLKIRVCSINRRASVVFSGGKARARSWKTSTSCPPAPNKSTGPNCGSIARTKDQFVSFGGSHGLDCHAVEVFRAQLCGNRALDFAISGANGRCIIKRELHATYVGLVSDGKRIELDRDRIAQRIRDLDCFVFRCGQACFNRRNSIVR